MSQKQNNELILQKAVSYLATREHSAKELTFKLTNKGFTEDSVKGVLLSLQQQNLQNDLRFSESFIRSCANKGRGQIKIRVNLVQRGVSDELITEAFNSQNINWHQNLKKVWQKKFNQEPKTLNEKTKQFRFLQQRGFATDDINSLIKI